MSLILDQALLAGLKTIELFSSTTGADIRLCEDGEARRVVVKLAKSADAARVLRGQARLMRRLSEFPEYAALYPPVLRETDAGYVIPFYPLGTVDDALRRGEDVAPLAAAAFDALFRVAAARDAYRAGALPDPKKFLREQFCFRAGRLRRAVLLPENEPARRAIGGGLERNLARIEAQIERYIASHDLDRSMGLCAHGDLGLDNVVVTGDAAAPVAFIDTRDNTPWALGLPWWDPVFDLATLILYHAHIEPAVAAVSATKGASRHARGRIVSEERFLSLAGGVSGFQAWAARDRGWRRRLLLAMTIRTLGSVGTQLTSAPDHRIPRALKVHELLCEFVERGDGA